MNGTNTALAAALVVAAIGQSASAQVWAVQPGTQRIITINPATGAILNQFAAPDALAAGQRLIGLSIAEGDNVLLYHNSANSDTTNYRLNPLTGAILSVESKPSEQTDGLSYQNTGSQHSIYTSHTGADVHRQFGYGGGEALFWQGNGTPLGGLGGDGHGREFMLANNGQIYEYAPFSPGVTLNIIPAPFTPGLAGRLEGLAFDGVSLYASDDVGTLYTLNPNTGAILNTVTVQGGGLFGLGAAIPTPAPLGILAVAAVIGGRRRGSVF